MAFMRGITGVVNYSRLAVICMGRLIMTVGGGDLESSLGQERTRLAFNFSGSSIVDGTRQKPETRFLDILDHIVQNWSLNFGALCSAPTRVLLQ